MTMGDDTVGAVRDWDAMRSRTWDAARRSERRRRRRHRVAAVAVAALVGASVTGAALALVAPPPPPPLDDDARWAAYLERVEVEWADLSARYPGADRPDVAWQRFITRAEEPAVLTACLTAQGIDVLATPSGPSVAAAPGEEERVDLAWFACGVQFPLDPNEFLPFTDAELDYWYAYVVNDLAACLAERGHVIHPPATAGAFREAYRAASWLSYSEVVVSDPDALERLERECPPIPPDLRR